MSSTVQCLSQYHLIYSGVGSNADTYLGPIVRISPDEVHCSDSRFIDEIYATGNRKRDKPIHQVRGTGT